MARRRERGGLEGDELVHSTKLMLLGILVMLSGFALNSVVTYIVTIRVLGLDIAGSLVYAAVALFVVGFILGVLGFFRN